MDLNITANETLYFAIQGINHTAFNVCSAAPPNIVSDGLWGGQLNGRIPSKSSLPVFELQVIVIFAITQICNFLLKRLDFPEFIGQILVSTILASVPF